MLRSGLDQQNLFALTLQRQGGKYADGAGADNGDLGVQGRGVHGGRSLCIKLFRYILMDFVWQAIRSESIKSLLRVQLVCEMV